MNLSAIVDRIEGFKAFQLTQLSVYRNAELFPHQPLGHQGVSRRETVFWMPKTDIWAVLNPSAWEGGRFWNCFGIGKPDPKKGLPITVEINPPHEGVNRRLAGLFARDEKDRIYIAHNASLGGSRGGGLAFAGTIGGDEWQEIATSKGTRNMIVFGPIDAPRFVTQLSNYVHRAAYFKKRGRGI